MEINRELVVEAITVAEVSPEAKLEGGRLAESYIDMMESFPDTYEGVLGVEVLWFLTLAPSIVVVGAVDRISTDFTLTEFKTRRAPKITKEGRPYKGDSEDDWLEEIGRSVQLAVYALAAREGHFQLDPTNNEKWTQLHVKEPRVRVRACVKSKPPMIWPTDASRGIFTFTKADLDATREALLAEAHMIRAARKAGHVPWACKGDHCFKYGRECAYLPDCKANRFPVGDHSWNEHDPGFKVCKLLGWDQTSPEFIVLSQSAYQTSQRCKEKLRRDYIDGSSREESFELDAGTAFHAALAAIHRQL